MIIGLDVGGTHTDVVLIGRQGIVRHAKVHTDSADLFHTVLSGIEQVTQGVDSKEIVRAVLSTTLTTNAIIQKKNPEVGMIVSAGPGINPESFRTNRLYFPVSGSIDHRGREIVPINEKEILETVKILKDEKIRNIGIVSKFSSRNSAHELKIYELIKEHFGKIFLGHRTSGNLNFPRRIATTFLNATVRQTHRKFFEAVQNTLKEKGLNIPIHILKADGGTMSFEASVESPAQTILSGPAASVMGAIAFAPENEDTLVMDIGGTTTDMAILINRAPLLAPLGIALGDYKTLIRSLETHSIGVGGDSVIRIQDGQVQIGPERSGPAMAFGGATPTPTDALVVLNLMKIGNKETAAIGIGSVAKELGTSIEAAANEILTSACQKILEEARNMIERINSKPVYTIHEIQEGYKVKPKTVLILGGPAPYFARRLEELSDFNVGVVPQWHVANAIGAAIARTTCEVTLFADTERGIATAPEESFNETVSKNFSKETAVEKAYQLLKQKAVRFGADTDDLETEVIEDSQFNMVRGFYTAGKNIRIKVQVRPGLISGYEEVVQNLLGDV